MVTLDQEGQNKSDEAVLAEIGYQQELKREWNLLQNFGVSFSIISVITGITTLFSTGLNVGGPAVMTWGWIGVSVMTVLVGLSMSEIVSAIPTSGGPYFWAAILAKPDKSALAAWITGWFNLVGQVAVTTGISYGCADLISSTAEIIHPDQYTATPGKIIGIYAALLISHGLLNTFGVGLLRLFNHSSIVLHSLGIGSLAIALLVKAQLHQSSQFVFFKFYDGTGGWGERASPAYVAACGILYIRSPGSMPVLTCPRRRKMQLAFLFSMQDFEGTLNAPQPVFKILVDVFGGVGAQVAMSLIILCVWHCGLFSVTSNSRMMYAFARDGGLPPKIFGLVDRRFDCPINTVWLSVVLAFLLALPSLGSAVALTAATRLPILLSVIWDERFRKGPFRLHRFSMPIRITSCLWIIVITVFFCLPNATPITRETLNYTPVVVGVLIVWIVLSWIFWARQSFSGPMIHDDHKGDVAITLPEGHSTYKNDATPSST
ncbi:hypothetical protein H4Q26_011614 [Puccinia striiformis f. sp. tritici PST-130]|nr:hypothetical protein H4Q26_011614 [Puccinia striiformis f. sp. tritici PST-130]